MRKKKSKQAGGIQFPLATVMEYGPDDKTVTKIVVAIFPGLDEEHTALERWLGPDVASDPAVAEQIVELTESHHVRTIIRAPRVIGCPHEEGVDFPDGGDCPHCPFWRGKQGSGAEGEQRWAGLDEVEVYLPRRGQHPFGRPRGS